MNRKERRAAGKHRGVGGAMADAPTRPRPPSIDELAAEASRRHRQGRIREAQEICRYILGRDGAHLQSLNLLGIIAQASGDHGLAVEMFDKALASDEFNAACHYNIGNSYQALNRRQDAIKHFDKALMLGMHEKAVENFIMQSPVIAWCVAEIAKKRPRHDELNELFGPFGLAALAEDLFLSSALKVMPLKSAALEALLGCARAELLRRASAQGSTANEIDGGMTAFACALAQQCFVNEYIFVQLAEEGELATTVWNRLLQDLTAGVAVSPLTLAAVASYFPLHSLPMAQALLGRDWPAAATELLRQQLLEPLEEARERDAIAALTPVKNSVSLAVMKQYEESPYPRWTINPLAAFTFDQARGKTNRTADRQAELEILIAGCGTGLHPIQVAQVYPNASILAVDISLTSLAYARRKTRELGLQNIVYAQADILELAACGRIFDRIESVGVLHHLAQPKLGWRVLLSLLRPGGKMRVGLYSEAARRVIVEARECIVERGYRATPDDIRTCRQDILGDSDKRRWKMLVGATDFYTMSGCRDLLFNVMEHRFTITEVATFLDENGLSFLGFEFHDDPTVIEKFQRQFPNASDLTSLDRWRAFEATYPETFWGMYVFVVGKSTP
jgi:SAM-dependent methyltransferase/tetratricopeptide (TPR) repeat protein